MEIMGVPSSDQRRSPRRSVHTGGSVSTGDSTHVAWVKDISDSGLCFFTNHRPKIGETIQVALTGVRIPSRLRRSYQGKVVRVQDSGNGAPIVAVAIMFGVVGAIVLHAA